MKEEIISKIREDYKLGLSLRALERKYGYSFSFIQKIVKTIDYNVLINKTYPLIENKEIVAICKKTNKKFKDYKNTSGILTTHLKKTYPDIQIPSNYIKKEFEYKSGMFWHHDYFYFLHEDKNENLKCKYCEWETSDLSNQSGAYKKHLKLIHNIEEIEEINSFNLIKCEICSKFLKSINNTHLKKHNISVFDYKKLYGDKITSDLTHEKLSKIAKVTNENSVFKKTSKPENDIKEYLTKVLKLKVSQSKRKILNGLEIDLLIEDFKIGIEFNGSRYHTELYGKKHKNYHINKTLAANKAGYKLIHIFEDEWEYKKDLIKNKLQHIFKLSTGKKIHSRKCNIIVIDENKVKINFLNKHHIQGNSHSNINIAAYYDNILIAIMCFNNKRNMNKEKLHTNDTYELTRFCIHNEYIANGIASRLLKKFIENYKPKKIISFADRRWTINENNLYTKLGFKLVKTLKPEYFYFNQKIDRYKRFHKFAFGKRSIKIKYPKIYSPDKTEWQMMQELGFDRIWDCGKFKYEL